MTADSRGVLPGVPFGEFRPAGPATATTPERGSPPATFGGGQRSADGLDDPLDSTPAIAEGPPHDQVTAAVAELVGRDERDERGRFARGNAAALVHGRRSGEVGQLSELLAPAKLDLAARLRTDLGLDDGGCVETMSALVDSFAEVSILRRALFARLGEVAGPVTGKGRVRAILSSYLGLLDRELKLATTLGLERKARPVSLADHVRREAARARREGA